MIQKLSCGTCRGCVPPGFAARHRSRRVMGVTVAVEAEWRGRLFLLDPRIDGDTQSALAFLQRVVQDTAPAVRQISLFHRLRRRAERVERLRLARELHDGPIQSLTAAAMQLAVARDRYAGNTELERELSALESLMRDEMHNLRDLTQDMRLGLLDPDRSHLVRECAELVERFGRQHGIRVTFHCETEFVRVRASVHRELLRLLHEALVNVRKHSGASEALVRLRVFAGRLVLSVEDDGAGFPFEGLLKSRDLIAGGHGPAVILERVRGLGGELYVESRPQHGSRLEIQLQIREPPNQWP